jgi:hypothetical protein
MPYTGMLALDGEEKPIRAEVDFTADDLVVSVASGLLGAWPLRSCRIETDGDRFLLDVDGDVAWFRPDDPGAFARQALTHRPPGGLASAVRTARVAGTVNPQVTAPVEPAVEEPVGEKALGSWWSTLNDSRQNLILAGVGIVVGVLIVATLLDGRSDEAPITPTALITTTTAEPVFELDLGELSMRWNDTSADLGLDLFVIGVPQGNRMEVDLGSDIVLYATADPATERVRTLMIGAGPGEGDQAQAVLATWGTMIALVNPELSPEERRGLLDELGVNVERPLQLGLATTAEQNGMKYWLRSGVLDGRVLLGVELP